MAPDDLSAAILHTKQEIELLKQIETATAKKKRRLRRNMLKNFIELYVQTELFQYPKRLVILKRALF